MSKIIVKKSGPLKGSVNIPGAKNSALKLMAASILAEKECIIENVPHLLDVTAMKNLLAALGLGVKHDVKKSIMKITPAANLSGEPPYELMQEMRASVVVLGPLLAKLGKVKLTMPGGCKIGNRPIDLHIKGLSALGAKVYYGFSVDGRQVITEDVVTLAQIKSSNGFIVVEAPDGGLKGADIYLDFPSVGATENIMMAATVAEGVTLIQNAAKEPEIIDLANFINELGGKIMGAGTDTIRITGVKHFGGTRHQTIPDRIIAITYMLGAVITGGEIELKNVMPSHLRSVTAKLREMGVEIDEEDDAVTVKTPSERLKGTVLTTLPYPGIPTDVQAPFMALLAVNDGTSIITENVFENRFLHVPELNKMGASITTAGHVATIKGVSKLTGREVQATDLRCGAALVLAGLVAEGTTVINGVHHIDRGYPRIEEDLAQLGADITRTEDAEKSEKRDAEKKKKDRTHSKSAKRK
ncbi:MAG: UDP-N-acetylglucosamine 1-carboxyvinyltransferase [Bacillota bacterium]|nr:UDP-N-acetylglucosamine 1-carboxyvinyltransferase [Bacillota bacterium]